MKSCLCLDCYFTWNEHGSCCPMCEGDNFVCEEGTEEIDGHFEGDIITPSKDKTKE